MEIIKKNIIINRPIKCGNTEIGVDGDIIVPDVKPDILKFLQADGRAIVTDTELSEGRLNISGQLDVNLLYVPDREDEKIKAIKATFDFSSRIDKNEIFPDMQVSVIADLIRLDCQVLNSRKLRIKAVIAISYEISEQASVALATGVDEASFETRVKPIELSTLVDMKTSEFNVRESFELPPGHTSIEELLKTDVKICDTDYKIVTGRAVIKGTLSFSALYLDTNCNVRCCDFESPFTEIFDIEDADEDTVCDISYFVKEFSALSETDSDGDMTIIALDALIGIKISATKKVNTELLIDCFCPGKETQIIKDTRELERIVSTGFYQTTVRDSLSAPIGSPVLSGIYNVFATPMIEKTEVLDNRVSVSGNISCTVLYIADSEETPIFSLKKNIPFSCTVDTPGSSTDSDCTLDAKIIHTSFNLNPANEAEIRCILAVSAKISVKDTLDLIDEIETDSLPQTKKTGIILYFVQKNDSLWDIAKRYFVSQDDILKVNNLEDGSAILEGMTLLIPTV